MNDNENKEAQEVEQGQEQQEERTFTQAEVDELINKRIARVKKGLPSDEELTAYRDWKSKQNPDADKKAAQDELDSARADAEMTRRENYLLKKGIDPEEVDYLVYRISKSMSDDADFDEAAEEYLKKHKQKSSAVRMDTGARLTNGAKSKSANEAMNDLIRNAMK